MVSFVREVLLKNTSIHSMLPFEGSLVFNITINYENLPVQANRSLSQCLLALVRIPPVLFVAESPGQTRKAAFSAACPLQTTEKYLEKC